MIKTSQQNSFGPDFKKMAPDFDRFMGLVKPVGEAIIKNMAPIEEDSLILDVACGTGEPGITLARSAPNIQIYGIDSVEKMIGIAQSKTEKENLGNITFEIMQAEHLRFDDKTFDYVISRFGLGMFGDTVQSLNEAIRVLKPEGRFSLAVWHDMSKNTLVNIIVRDLQKSLKAELPEDLAKMFERAPGANAASSLEKAGCKLVETAEFSWSYHFDKAEQLREFLIGPATMMFAKALDTLSPAESEAIMSGVFVHFSSFQKDDGSYEIPHTCQLIFGHK